VNQIYLGAVAFGITLLVASLVLGGKDTDHGGGHHASDAAAPGFGWAPLASVRFWIFLLAFGGGAGLALTALGEGPAISATGAGALGWVAGVLAVGFIRSLSKNSASSEVHGDELIGATGHLVLPAGPDKPGKVRVDIKGRTEDFVAHLSTGELPTGSPVLIVAEGELGSLIVERSVTD